MQFKIIPYSEMRYPTCGDYYHDRNGWHFVSAELSKRRYSWLILIHEFVEFLLCKLTFVDVDDIDRWDIAYERSREVLLEVKGRYRTPDFGAIRHYCGCEVTTTSEPGDDQHAPYRTAHRIATWVEKACAFVMGVDWAVYEAEVETL